MQKHLVLLLLLAFTLTQFSFGQCTTTNGTSCQCQNGGADCDLLPDIIVANEPLEVAGTNGVIEYSQTGNGVENGRLRISVSTPNIGHGPLTVRASSIFICGADTFTSNPGTCPDGSSPRNLCFQRIYHRNNGIMTFYDRPAGSMTYHPTHQHMHVDDWGIYTLRTRDTAIADPLQWPIIGTGAKLGFCLMDYGDCSYYNGHCVDSLGNTLMNADFPNFGLGGGNYNCSPIEQGISSGYADIYFQYLDGMYITIPPGTCNGDYYMVVQIDPHNYFLEERENNNVIAIPYTLTQQVPAGNGNAIVTTSLPTTTICEGTGITLTANSGNTYHWSTNDTTQSITVTQAGNYSVSVNSQCGTATSHPVTVNTISSHVMNVTGATGCEGVAALTATTTGTAHWFNAPAGGNDLHTGNSYAPSLPGTNTFYVESHDTLFGLSATVGPADSSIGAGAYYSNDQHEIFTVFKPLILKSVKVYANSTMDRTIELRNAGGTVLQSKTVNIAQGEQTVTLNFYIDPATDYQLGWTIGSSPDLYRNTTGATYPYIIPSLISITGNSAADLARWYGYYDWHVEEQPATCISNRMPVIANITAAPAVTLSGLDTVYSISDAAVTLTGTPTGGTFSGAGVTGNSFNPSSAGVGGPFVVSYQYTDNNTGCPGTAVVMVTVRDTNTAVSNIDGISEVKIFPNPNDGRFEITFRSDALRTVTLIITDQLGRKLVEEKNLLVKATYTKQVNAGQLSKGIYQLILASEKKRNVYKLVVE